MKNPKRKITEAEVEKHAREWLRGAKDRNGGRQNRQKQQQQQRDS